VSTAPHPHHARDGADHPAGGRDAGGPERPAPDRRREPEQHLTGDHRHVERERDAQAGRGQHRRQGRPREAAGEDARRRPAHNPPEHCAARVMGAQARDRREEHARHRGAEGELRRHIGGKLLARECEHQGRDDDEAAADAEQPREKPRGAPRRSVDQPDRHRRGPI
jgi:hypothetical protein